MADNGSILLRRGPTEDRLAFVPLKGEIIYDTDTQQVYIGDGQTYGGKTVFDDTIVVEKDGSVKVGENVAIIVDDEGNARALRVPGGDESTRPAATIGMLRYNSSDGTLEYSDGEEWFYINVSPALGQVIQLYVSKDGDDTGRYGKQAGRSWGTSFRTINKALRLAEDIINAATEKELQYQGQYVKVEQIMVYVSTGIFKEHLPLRVPNNTSIYGAGQRRTVVRPLAGEESQSPWVRLRFWRETPEYPTGFFGFHYLTDPSDQYSTPKDNQDIDIFLCNNTNWFHEFSTEDHNSFAFVLDPEGQILNKSPYPHTGASFSKSSYSSAPYDINFAGGMFADGFVGNQDFNIDSVDTASNSMITSGFWREPGMPTAFYADGYRFQADSTEPPPDGMLDAASLLQQNRTFIQDETVAYVDDTYQFQYDRLKCRRDLRIILEASSYDIVLGTNYNAVLTGVAYQRPTTSYLKQSEKVETIDAINFAKGKANLLLASNTSLQTANVQAFNEVMNALNTGTVNDIVWPDVANKNKNNARLFLDGNRDYIKAEVIAFIDKQVEEGIAPFTTDYTYDKIKCQRDTDYVIDALIYDILFEGNSAITRIAESYWTESTTHVYGQQEQTAAAYAYVKTILSSVILGVPFPSGYQIETSQNLKAAFPATVDEVTLAEGLLSILEEVVVEGLSYLPLTAYPNLTSLDTNIINLRDSFVHEFSTIIDETIDYIELTYNNFSYVKDTCYRDVGLIVDAIIFDLTYGGEISTITAALTYTETGVSVIADQELETIEAIDYVKELLGNVLNQTAPTTIRTDTSQFTDAGLIAESGSISKAQTLIDIITNHIQNHAEIKVAHDIISSAKESIQDDVISYINTTYPTLVYNQTLCRRDVGHLVSAVSNDLFGSSRNSVIAALAYYRAESSLGDPSVAITAQKVETIAGVAKAKELVKTALANASVSIDLQNLADSKFDIIIDIMDNGESAAPDTLPKFKINVNTDTPLLGSLAGRNLTMITAGNKSFVATDWTMFGNLGYGVLTRNNARIELVSIFTYYCGVSYKAESGSEIRSLNGSSTNGIYGLAAEGRNPFEIPIRATTVSETCFVAQADSSVVGENVAGDLTITIKNATDVLGNPATLFNVMVADVDTQDPDYGIVRYEIGNLSGNKLNIRGTAQGLLTDIPDNANISIRLLQEYEIDTSGSIDELLLGAALVFDDDPTTGYRIIGKTPHPSIDLRYKVRTIPTLNHIGVVLNGASVAGSNSFVVNAIPYSEEDILDRRIAYQGVIYTVTGFNELTNTISVSPSLSIDFDDGLNLRLSPQPGSQGNIFTDFSVVKANNHDMLDVGTGAYEDSNYPRELYGPPVRPAVQSQEVNEIAPGRVFFTTNDQDGNYRVGDYFRVNQGDGSVTFSAAIALSNLDGLGFTRGVVVNEFSSDSDMIDESDEALPTEQAVVNYINKRIGQNKLGQDVGSSRIGPGLLVLDGSQPMEGDLNLDTFNVNNVDALTANTIDVNTAATLASAKVEDLTAGRVVIAGTSGEIEDDTDLTYNKTTNVLSVPTIDVSVQADLASAKVEDLTPTRIVLVGTGGELVDDANLSFDGLTFRLTGDLDVNSQGSFTSANVEDLTNNRIIIAGLNGELEDDANLTFDGTTFEVGTKFDITASSGNTAIGGTLGVDGNITINKASDLIIKDAAVTPATVFSVDGATGDVLVGGSITVSDFATESIVFTGPSGILQVNSDLKFDGNTFAISTDKFTVTAGSGATTIAGTLNVGGEATLSSATVSDLTASRVVIAGSNGSLNDSVNLTFDGTTLSTSKISVDNITLDDSKITLIGAEIYATGNASTGDIYMIPKYNPSASPVSYSTVYITGNLSVQGSISTTESALTDQTISGSLVVNGNTTLGDAATDTVTVNAKVNSHLIPNTTGLTIGSATNVWEALYVNDIITSDDVTINTSGDFVIKNSAAPTPATVFSITGATGNTSIAGTLSATGNFAINTNKFNIVASSGNTSIAGTLGVTGATTIAGTFAANGGITVDTNKFVVADVTGNVSTAGTLSATGNFAINTNKFNIVASSGNTSIAGTLGVTGATTIAGALAANGGITVDTNKFVVADVTGNVSTAGTLSATGNFAINTNKFTVTAATGNTSIAGTLGVTGATTIGGNASITGTLGVSSNIYMYSSYGLTIVTTAEGTAISPADVRFDVDGSTGDVYAAGTVDIGGNLNVTGDLTVSGQLLSDLKIEDNTVVLNYNYIGNPNTNGVNAGVQVERGTGSNVEIRWNEATDKWQFAKLNPSTGAAYYEDIASTVDVSAAAENDYVSSASFAASTGVITLTRASTDTVVVDIDGRYQENRTYQTSDSTLITGAKEGRFNYASSGNWNVESGTNGSDTGTGGSFSQNGDGNLREYGTDPFGNRSILWVTRNNDATSNADGGWNKTITNLSGTRSYMSVVYVRRTSASTNGTFYHGCSGSTTSNLNGTNNTNPYFSSFGISTLPQNVWCVSIGFIQAAGDSNSTNIVTGGLYRLDTGAKITSYTTFKWRNSTDTSQTHRTYLYYSTDPAAELHWWGPGFYELNGHEPTLADLLDCTSGLTTGPISATSISATSTTSDTLTSKTTNANLVLSGNGSGVVDISDSLRVNSITSYSANTNLTLSGAGTGTVYINDTASVIGTLTTQSILPDNNTRNIGSSGTTFNTIYASVFNGTATQAKYADLAEIYSTDQEYDPGTVVEFGGTAELTQTTKYASIKVAGVISTQPAHLMNSVADGQPLALKGRVPCKVVGRVHKGDLLIASDIPGVAIVTDTYIGGAVIGKAIENNSYEGVKIIEIFVGVM